ncbi:hypothetical protein D3C72_1930220 [compost metagenome]
MFPTNYGATFSHAGLSGILEILRRSSPMEIELNPWIEFAAGFSHLYQNRLATSLLFVGTWLRHLQDLNRTPRAHQAESKHHMPLF